MATVLTGAGRTALDNRMRGVGQMSGGFWAGQEHTGRGYGYGSTDAAADGDFYLDVTGKVPLVVATLDLLQQHGPMGPVWFRVVQERGRESEQLLQVLNDAHTKAGYDRHRELRRRAAEAAGAERQRREAAGRQLLDEAWERSEWFKKRKRETKELAGKWDEAASVNGR